MSDPLDLKLYDKVKRAANEKFDEPTSAYKSMWISREYKKRGGKYSGKKDSSRGLRRWLKEEWVDLKRPKRNSKGKVIGYAKCGRSSKLSKYPLCRPSKRVSSKTPRTLKELPKSILKRAMTKKKSGKRVSFQKGGGVQYHGRKSDVMFDIPKGVKVAADRAFKMMEKGFKGGHETGWKRAQQLTLKNEISIQDLRYIRNWFARHFYTSYPAYKEWKKAGKPMEDPKFHRKRGIIAWELWGGDAALRWVNRYTSKLNDYFKKEYTEIK
jgi:hypothetical protein